jgi:hypothetical protein
MIEIDGFLWFVAALIICGAHALYLRGWRRERRQSLAWWQGYNAEAQRRHCEFMIAVELSTRRSAEESRVPWALKTN